MLNSWIVRKVIKGENIINQRQRYGYLGGIVGIIINLLLFGIKFLIGTIVNSISITADAFNNLSDVGSSAVTIVGFKIADKPADKDHPFGHGRGEYISGLIVSFLVMMVGVEFLRNSFDRVLHPSPLRFQLIPFLILILSVFVKVWLGSFNRYLGKLISSSTLNASSMDSFSDVIITSCTALSLILSKFTKMPVDGYIGLIVSGLILFAGYSLVKDTISPLLGEAPSPELVKNIMEGVVSYDGIIGAHDLIVHSYGVEKFMASIHAELPSTIPVIESHEIVDRAEKEISEKLNILLVIHMDPVNVDNKEINETRHQIEDILKDFPQIISIHDFRIVGKGERKNILFDMIVSDEIPYGKEPEIKANVKNAIKKHYSEYNLIIGVDRDYTKALS